MKVNRLTQIRNRWKGEDGENLRGKQHTYLKGGARKRCPRRAQTGLGKEAKLD